MKYDYRLSHEDAELVVVTLKVAMRRLETEIGSGYRHPYNSDYERLSAIAVRLDKIQPCQTTQSSMMNLGLANPMML